MESAFGPVTILLATLVVILYTSVKYFCRIDYNDQEPPLIKPTIPYIGHILGLLRHGQRYMEQLSARNGLPIYTIQMLSKKTYVVISPELIQAVDRSSKTITFYPFIAMISPRLFDIGERTLAIVKQNLNLEEGPWGLCHDVSHGMHTAMLPGPNLDRMNQVMLEKFIPRLDELGSGAEKSPEVDLFRWARRVFAVASTEAIYGPGNPFSKRPSLEDDFWSFDEGFTALLFGIPSPAGRRAHAGRARVFAELKAYFDREEQAHGLDVIKNRVAAARKYGSTNDDMSRYEIGDLIGILINATPAFFWMLLDVYSDESLLASLREEIDAVLITNIAETESESKPMHQIDITTLQERCPLLISTFKETLRYHTHHAASRWISEDTMLAGKYLLTKDSILQVPAGVAHANTAVWGDDADTFNAHRFLKRQEDAQVANSKSTRVPQGAFRAWGGGQTLCPGRFFATAEITSTVAMMIARFDMEPADGGGVWKIPKEDGNRVASSIHPPSSDIKVKLTTRKGYEGHKWGYVFATEQ